MKEVILSKLKEIEEKENVRILLAVESGSRSWGFASPDSDYDVRFLYVRDRKDYLRLNTPRDTIEWELNEVMDINGWDICKALRLMRKSNPTIFEWLADDAIIYHNSEEADALRRLSKQYFLERTLVLHYVHMARGQFSSCTESDSVKLKKYLYALRAVLAAKYIIDHHEMTPLSFHKLMQEELDHKWDAAVEEWLKLKESSTETVYIQQNNEMNHYLSEEMRRLEEEAEKMDIAIQDWEGLNQYFLGLLDID